MPITPSGKIWMDGEYVDWDEARVHVLTPSLHYGWGVVEGIRAYATDAGPAVFRLTDHMKRLYRSAKIYHIEPPVSLEGAVKAGYDEGILLNPNGYVTDGSGENVFAVRDGVLHPPPLAAGCLAGLTRDSIITIAENEGIEVRQTDLVRTDLYLADEAFFTGTAAEVVPIREVDDRVLGDPGPITRRLQEVFSAATTGRDERYRDWVEPVA